MKKTKPAAIALTDEHRRAFDGYVRKWQRMLNLIDWRIGVSVVPARGKVLANVGPPDLSSRTATIRLGAAWDENNPPTPQELEDTACHEVLHVFLHEMIAAHQDAAASDEDRASSEHRVIQVLCNLMVPNPRDE